MTTNILITGGLGYLGGRIAQELLRTAPALNLRLTTRRSRDAVPEWANDLDVRQVNTLDLGQLSEAVTGIDVVIHLAAVNEIVSLRDPELALDVNTRGTHRLLTACKDSGVKRFIYFSTFHVYGPGACNPITEETATRPVHPYALTHRAAEDFVNWHRHACGMETLILRLSNGYGYPADPFVDRWSLVFNDLCRQAVETGRVVIRSSGKQHRDFVTLTDVARAVHHFLTLGPQSWADGLFNLGGARSLSILDVAQIVAGEYRKRYDRDLAITTGQDPVGAVHAPIEYDIGKLVDTGFSLTNPVAKEIQGTLALCEQVSEKP